jgi:hypothetical protein
MNIIEAFNKLTENPRVILEHRGTKYIRIEGIIYENNRNEEEEDYYKPLFLYEYNFKLADITSNDWQVIDSF